MFSADTCRRLLAKLTHVAHLVIAEQSRTAEPSSFDDDMMAWLSSLEHDEFRAWEWLDLNQAYTLVLFVSPVELEFPAFSRTAGAWILPITRPRSERSVFGSLYTARSRSGRKALNATFIGPVIFG
jgi:hypothetical protein